MSKRNIDWEDEFDFEKKKSDNKELLRFIGRLLSNWYWFLLCGLIGFSCAFTYLRYTMPSYKVHAKLLVSDDKKGGGMMSSTALGDLSSLMGTKSSVDNEVEVLKTADLMREMVLAEKAYISYFNQGTVHSVPVMSAPFRAELLTSPDSIMESYIFEVRSTAGDKVEISNADTLFQVAWNESFTLPNIGVLRLEQTGQGKPKEYYGFQIEPVRAVAASLSEMLTVEVTNKNVS